MMTGFDSKRQAAKDKEIVTDIDGHVVRDARKPKRAAALDRDAEIERLNEKIEFLARTNMLYSDWEHRDTQVTSDLIRKGIEEAKINAELRAEIERLKAQLAQPEQEPEPDALTVVYMSGVFEGRKLEREALEAEDWTTIMRYGSLVTWGDAEELGDRVRAAIRARKNT